MSNVSTRSNEFIYGIWPVIEALRAGTEIEKLLLQSGVRSPQLSEIMGLAKRLSVPFQWVPPEKLNRITRKNHQGVIAFMASVEYQKIEHLLPLLFEAGIDPFLLLLDKITDVRNIGAIARTAEAAGVHALLIPARGSALIGADAVKASAGALTRINICREDNLKDTIGLLKESGVKVVAISEKTDRLIWQSDLKGPIALLLGSEDQGVSPAYLELADEKLSIPMLGEIRSLNVSVAAGIACYEVVRNRMHLPSVE